MKGESAVAPRYSVPALEKGLDILELLARSPTGMTVTAMSQRLGRSTGELYRIVQLLDFRGYVDRDRDSDLYSLSFRLFQLSHEHPPIRSLAACAAPEMEALAVAIGQSCHLAVRNRVEAAIVAQVDSPLPIRHSVRLGASFPVWETSSGLALCAFLKPAEAQAMLAEVRERIDGPAFERFGRQLEEVRARGYEQRESLMIGGITNLSRPVRNHAGDVVAVLTVPYMEQRGNPVGLDGASAALASAVGSIAAALGASAQRRAVA